MVKSLPLEIHSKTQPGSARLEVSGELDIASAPRLEEVANELFSRQISGLVVDLGGITFIDSSGLRTLIALNDRASEASCTLELIAPPEPARSVFHITGADRNLPFVEEPPGR